MKPANLPTDFFIMMKCLHKENLIKTKLKCNAESKEECREKLKHKKSSNFSIYFLFIASRLRNFY